jgi:hypothetical protein
MVLDYERISHGYRPMLNADGTPFVMPAGPDKGQHVLIERVELRERLVCRLRAGRHRSPRQNCVSCSRSGWRVNIAVPWTRLA